FTKNLARLVRRPQSLALAAHVVARGASISRKRSVYISRGDELLRLDDPVSRAAAAVSAEQSRDGGHGNDCACRSGLSRIKQVSARYDSFAVGNQHRSRYHVRGDRSVGGFLGLQRS